MFGKFLRVKERVGGGVTSDDCSSISTSTLSNKNHWSYQRRGRERTEDLSSLGPSNERIRRRRISWYLLRRLLYFHINVDDWLLAFSFFSFSLCRWNWITAEGEKTKRVAVVFGKVQNFLSLSLSFSLKHTNRNESLFHSPSLSLLRFASLLTRANVGNIQSRTNDLRMIEILLSFVKLPCSCRFLHKHCSLTLPRAPVGLLTANAERATEISCQCRAYFLVILRREGNFDKPRSFIQSEGSIGDFFKETFSGVNDTCSHVRRPCWACTSFELLLRPVSFTSFHLSIGTSPVTLRFENIDERINLQWSPFLFACRLKEMIWPKTTLPSTFLSSFDS